VEAVAGQGVDLGVGQAAEEPTDAGAGRDERGGLLRDDAQVVRLRQGARALALELEDLGLGHRDRRPGQRLQDAPVVVPHQHREGLRVEVVAHQQRGVVPPPGVGRGLSPPQRRPVHHVVVDQGGGVEQLDGAREPDRPGAAVSGQPGGQQQQHGPQALAAGRGDGGAHLLDQRHRGVELPADLLLHREQVGADERLDTLPQHPLDGRGGHAAGLT
jgi:hypothetical protein